jgi:hypothetical protein
MANAKADMATVKVAQARIETKTKRQAYRSLKAEAREAGPRAQQFTRRLELEGDKLGLDNEGIKSDLNWGPAYHAKALGWTKGVGRFLGGATVAAASAYPYVGWWGAVPWALIMGMANAFL